MKIKTNKQLAENIADTLMTNGSHERAVRIQLRGPNERDLGGWCRAAMVEQILEKLNKHRPEVKP